MQIMITTTEDETELYKALISKKKIKELEGTAPFTISEMCIMEPEEGEEGVPMAALKVGSHYYSGISQDVVKTAIQTISMLNRMDEEKKTAFMERTKFQVVKSSGGRYGKLVLEAV